MSRHRVLKRRKPTENTFVVPPMPAVPGESCDRCTAAGVHTVTHPGQDRAELVLCDHHARAHEPALLRAGWVIVMDGGVR